MADGGAGVPAGIGIVRHGDAITITRRWRDFQAYFLVIFTAFWALSLYRLNGPAAGDAGGPALYLHVAVGAAAAYLKLAWLLNRTNVQVDRSRFSVRHGPIPWRKGADAAVGAVATLYTRDCWRGKTHPHEVRVTTRDGRDLRLTGHIGTAAQARSIERVIGAHRGIGDLGSGGGPAPHGGSDLAPAPYGARQGAGP